MARLPAHQATQKVRRSQYSSEGETTQKQVIQAVIAYQRLKVRELKMLLQEIAQARVATIRGTQ